MKKTYFAGFFCLILSRGAQVQAQNTFPATGNVGIGTTAPSAPLSFGTTLGDSKLALWDDGTRRYGFGIQNAQFRFHVGAPSSRFSFFSAEAGTELMTLTGTGNLGIGTSLASNPNNYKLAVNGIIGAKAVQVEITSTTWSDYVFLPSYRLRPLSEVERYIQANSHLPEVPSAAQVAKDGINLGEMDATLLKKIEELTLYLIEQNKQLHEQNKQLQEQNKKLETQHQKIDALEKQLFEDKK
jgi:hypothetical protein